MRSETQAVTQEMVRDLRWWDHYLSVYDNVSIMWMQQCKHMDGILASDVCLEGMGGFCKDQYVHGLFPKHMCNNKSYSIAVLELVALVVSLKVWQQQLQHLRFVVLCDNEAVVNVINKGTAHDTLLQEWLQELVL